MDVNVNLRPPPDVNVNLHYVIRSVGIYIDIRVGCGSSPAASYLGVDATKLNSLVGFVIYAPELIQKDSNMRPKQPVHTRT